MHQQIHHSDVTGQIQSAPTVDDGNAIPVHPEQKQMKKGRV
ncbi:hypothetical protein [Phocaeicola sp.]